MTPVTAYAGTLPLGSLPRSLESLGLPTFEAGPESGPARLAAGLQAAAGASSSATDGGLPQPQALQSGEYSPTARLPRKLVTKIQSLEFVEMSEMLPETWWPDTHEGESSSRRPSRRSPITDVLVWTECFALMAAVLAEKYPAKSPQLWAYLRRIVHAARNYQGAAWVAYDRAYRRQALAQGSLDWAREDSALYNEAFVGHAKLISRCRHCLSEFHSTEACPELPTAPPPWPTPYALGPAQVPPPLPAAQEICRKFNENRCFVRRCKYRHACLGCGQPHPVALCNIPPSNSGAGHFGRDRSPLPFHNRNPRAHRQ